MTSLRKLIIGIILAVLAAPLVAAPFAYINDFGLGTVSVLDLATQQFGPVIEVGKTPRVSAVDPARSRLYVARVNELAITIIDTDTNTVLGDIEVNLEPVAMAVNPVNGELYIVIVDFLNANSGAVVIAGTDLTKGTESIQVGNQAITVAVTPDGEKLFIGTFANEGGVVIDVGSRNIEDNFALSGFPASMLASPDGTRIYTSVTDLGVGSLVDVLNTNTRVVTDSIVVGQGANDMAITADGAWLYTADVIDNTVSVMDTDKLEVVDTIEVGTEPRGIDVALDGTVVVTNTVDDTVSVITDVAKASVTTIPVADGSFPLSAGTFILGSAAILEIDATWSGAWYDPSQNGHGFLLQVLSGGVVLVYWFTFDSTGAPTWFFGVGTIDGDTITVPLLFEPDGPSFPPFFDPADFMPVDWGLLILRFFDCDLGEAEWESLFAEFGSGMMDLERITSTDTLECEI